MMWVCLGVVLCWVSMSMGFVVGWVSRGDYPDDTMSVWENDE